MALTCWLAPHTARAAGDCQSEASKRLFDEGRKLYDLGRFEEAAERWERAYLECDSPQLIFNLAQAQRRAGRTRKAIDLYKRWRDLASSASADERADVEQKIAALEAALLTQREREPVGPSAPEPKPSTREPQPLPAAPPTRPEEPSAPQPRWYQDGWGWALTGTGALVTSAGVVWMTSAGDEASVAGSDDQANPAKLGGAVSAVFGIALLGAGVVKLLLVEGSAAHDRTARAPAPCLCVRF